MQLVEERPALSAPPANAAEVPFWLSSFVARLYAIFSQLGQRANGLLPKDGSERATAALPLATYTVATRPAASSVPWSLIAVTNGAGGAQFQASNGSAWVNLG